MIQRLPTYIACALPIAAAWMAITNAVRFDAFAVGMVIGLALAFSVRPTFTVRWRTLPAQLWALIVYVVTLARDIVLSGVDVARRVLSPDMRLRLGVIAVKTQDPKKSSVIAALSASAITLTPGELVVEIKEGDTMYIHCLDADRSGETANREQLRRVALLRRIRGGGEQ